MKLGFIGTGKIASSIILGIFKSKLKVSQVYISSRNRNIAKKLSQKFKKVKIIKDNQEIINKASHIILSVTPEVGKKILPKLNFKNKKIISLISTIRINQLKQLCRSSTVVKAIPLPPIENRLGPIVICPASKAARNIFKYLGEVVEVSNEKASYRFWSAAALMATYYEMLNTTTNYLTTKGVNKTKATKYVGELFSALTKDALLKQRSFKQLVAESQTPNGINMQVLKELKKGKFFNKLKKSLKNINKRLSK